MLKLSPERDQWQRASSGAQLPATQLHTGTLLAAEAAGGMLIRLDRSHGAT